ncbi:DHS-like NAD/FAD-binding domain-containing protein [Hyaloraphidium curvatum]|nr:DHS-like NAD/FAD-binding domain-containing protein [Hyaloraphidium curvatum]
MRSSWRLLAPCYRPVELPRTTRPRFTATSTPQPAPPGPSAGLSVPFGGVLQRTRAFATAASAASAASSRKPSPALAASGLSVYLHIVGSDPEHNNKRVPVSFPGLEWAVSRPFKASSGRSLPRYSRTSLPLSRTFSSGSAPDDGSVTSDSAKHPPSRPLRDALHAAAVQIARSDVIIVTAGAGFAFESGVADLRTPEGFAAAFPAFAALGLTLYDVASLSKFRSNPRMAWAFYATRYDRALEAQPHEGYHVLLNYANTRRFPPFVYTTQIEGLFRRAGLPAENILEIHGSINHLACLDKNCTSGVTRVSDSVGREDGRLGVKVDRETMLADVKTIPRCTSCGSIMRPNILMLGDSEFKTARVDVQKDRFDAHLRELTAVMENEPPRIVVIEVGAGLTNPVLRNVSESLVRSAHGAGFLIRINPGEAECKVPRDVEGVGLRLRGARAMVLLDKQIKAGEKLLTAEDVYVAGDPTDIPLF